MEKIFLITYHIHFGVRFLESHDHMHKNIHFVVLLVFPSYLLLFSPSVGYVWLFATPWTAACQASPSVTIPQSLFYSHPLNWWCHPTISSPVVPFSSCLQSFPTSGSFPISPLFTLCGQSIGDSASTENIQGWFPLGLTGLISLLSKRSWRVLSNTSVQKHQFFRLISLYGPTLTSVPDYWKNHSLTDFCWQSDVSAF